MFVGVWWAQNNLNAGKTKSVEWLIKKKNSKDRKNLISIAEQYYTFPVIDFVRAQNKGKRVILEQWVGVGIGNMQTIMQDMHNSWEPYCTSKNKIRDRLV